MLREYATQGEIDKLQNALYDFNPDVKEEGFENEEKPVLADDEAPATEMVKTTTIDEDEEEIYEDIKSNISNQKDDGEE
jgi:seryl-tRNA synthetase